MKKREKSNTRIYRENILKKNFYIILLLIIIIVLIVILTALYTKKNITGKVVDTTSNLQAYYKLDGNARDETTNFDGSSINSVNYVTGNNNQAANFTGSNHIKINSDIPINENGTTVNFWINIINSLKQRESFVSKSIGVLASGNEYIYNIGTGSNENTGKLVLHTSKSGFDYFCITDSNITLNQWVYVTIAFNKTDCKIYLNSVLNKTQTSIMGINQALSYPTYIGGGYGGLYNVTALIDDVRIYTRFLTQEDISNLYSGVTQTCAQNWTARNTSCLSNEIKTIYYVDTNSCNNETSKPGNITQDCDNDNNGIIGNSSSVSATSMNISVYIDSNLLNLSKNYNSTRTVEIKNNNETRIKFDYSFSYPLNLKSISITKQSTSNYGFMIVEGINISKKIYIDIINSTNKVCAKNSHITSVTEITTNCTGISEFLINCPGTNSSYSCNISSSFYEISGLTNSGAREISESGSCSSNWNCTNWIACVNNLQTRTCNDINNCNSSIKLEQQSCIVTPQCTPNWNCTWVPEKCPKNKTQVKRCIDENNCNLDSEMPAGTKSCERKSNLWIYLVLGGLFLIIIIIIILVIIFNRSSEEPATRVISTYSPPALQYPVYQQEYPQEIPQNTPPKPDIQPKKKDYKSGFI